MKEALNLFGAGDVFNNAIAFQLFQAEKQKAVDLQDVEFLQKLLLTSSEA